MYIDLVVFDLEIRTMSFVFLITLCLGMIQISHNLHTFLFSDRYNSMSMFYSLQYFVLNNFTILDRLLDTKYLVWIAIILKKIQDLL